MEISEAKLKANQQNARLSTGPITDEGKATSARNSLKHGLTARKTTVLPTENQADLDALAAGMHKDFHPYNTTEVELVDQLIDVQWRLRRASHFEAVILLADSPDFKALNNMSLHAARLKRQFSATLKEFQALHALNREQITNDLKCAEKVHKADQILERPSTLADLGFDFTIDYLEKWSNRQIAMGEAETVVREAKWAADEEEEEDDDDDDYEDDTLEDQAA